MARFDPELSQWIRWLHVAQQLPTATVAAVLGRDSSFIDEWFEREGSRLRFIPSGPPRRNRRPGPHQLISGRTGTRIRILRDLGYNADRIAAILGLDPAETAEFLQRLTPIRCASLCRPRERRRRKPQPTVHPDDIGPDGLPRAPMAIRETPSPTKEATAPAEASSVLVDQVQPAPSPGNEWIGSWSPC
jgi:hypothetical protein